MIYSNDFEIIENYQSMNSPSNALNEVQIKKQELEKAKVVIYFLKDVIITNFKRINITNHQELYVQNGYSYSYPNKEKYKRIRKVLEKAFTYLNEQRESFSEITDKKIKILITNKLATARKNIGWWEKAFKPKFFQDKEVIQHIIAPELKVLREKLQNKEIKETNPQFQLEFAIAQAKLMCALKYGGGKTEEGCTGAQTVSWLDKKEIAVFKCINNQSTNESRSIWHDEKSFLNKMFNWGLSLQSSHLPVQKNSSYEAEVASYLVDQYFHLGIVPPTGVTELDINGEGKKTGSFQLFKQNCKFIETIIHKLNDSNRSFDPLDIIAIQKVEFLGYLLGNIDQHGQNVLYREGIGNRLFSAIYQIDGGATFPKSHPEQTLISDCKFNRWWKDLYVSKLPFCEEVRTMMLDLTDDKLEEIIAIIEDQLPNYLEKSMIKNFFDRGKVLRVFAGLTESCPYILGDIRTEEEIQQFFKNPYRYQGNLETLNTTMLPTIPLDSNFMNESLNFVSDEEEEEEEISNNNNNNEDY